MSAMPSRSRSQIESAVRLWSGVRRLYRPGTAQWTSAHEYYAEALSELTYVAGDEAVEAVQREIIQHLTAAADACGPDKPTHCCHQGRDAPGGRLSVFRMWYCPERATHRVSWTTRDGTEHANYYCDAHAPAAVPSKYKMKLQRLSAAGATR